MKQIDKIGTDQILLRKHKLHDLAGFTIIVAAAVAILFSFSVLRARSELSDFAGHWSACRLFRTNPYDIGAITQLQKPLAAYQANIQVMGNPPWTALLIFPYAIFPYAYATALWVITSVLILWFVSICFWRFFGQNDNTIALLVTFIFAPTIALLSIGQVDAILPLGMALFLIGENRRNWFLAGLGLALFSVKPHLMLLPAAAIVLWSMRTRHWRLLFAGISILGLMILTAALINHSVFSQWFTYLSRLLPTGETFPTLANSLALLHPWLRFVPLAFGVAVLGYRFVHVPAPDWKFELPLMTAVGLATSFYGYYHDQILALPLLLYAYAKGNRKIFWILFCLANALIFVHLEAFPNAGSWYYFPVWTATGWLLICIASLRENRGSQIALSREQI